MSALITLTGKRPSGRLSRQLYELQQEGCLCDTIIEAEDGSCLYGHSCVLTSVCDLLNDSLTTQAVPLTPDSLTQPVFKIKTDFVSLATWKQIVEYAYLGQATLVQDDLQNLAEAADSLDLSELKTLAEETYEMYNQVQLDGSKPDKSPDVDKVSIGIQTDQDILKFTSGHKSAFDPDKKEPSAAKLHPDSYLLFQSADGSQHLVHAEPLGQEERPHEYIIHPKHLQGLTGLSSSTSALPDAITMPHEIMPDTSMDPLEGDTSMLTDVMGDDDMADDVSVVTEQTKEKRRVPAGINPRGRPKAKQEFAFKCGDCERFYSSKQALERHMLLHSSYAPYTCEQCGKTFKTDRYLAAHIERHKESRPHQCAICSKRFKTKRDVNWHRQTVHTDVKNYHCQMCSFSAKTAALLKQHVLSHTNTKEWICKTCGKAFLRKQHLEQHAVRHEGKRPFACSVCRAEFYTIYSCKEHHLRVHQGLKRYRCAVCYHEYNEKKSFIQHLHKHSVDVLLQVEENVVLQPVEDQEVVGHSVMLKDELSVSDSLVIESVLNESEVVL